jgi:DNA polymerase-3 subunit delta
MPVLTEARLHATIHTGQVAPVYLLVGDDEVGKAPVIEALCNLVEADLQAFNVQRIFVNEGRPGDVLGSVVAAARTLPLLGDRRVVLALRCEAVLKPKRKASATADDDDGAAESEAPSEGVAGDTAELERYLAAPSSTTVLVLVAADLARNTRLAKLLLRVATVVEFWGLKTERDAKGRALELALEAGEQYVRDRAREAGLRIAPDAIVPLLEHAGPDIGVLRNDVERLITYCAGRPGVTLEDVRAVVGGAIQLDDWALTRAIEQGDAGQALRQLHLGLEAGQSPWMILGQLAWFVRARLSQSQPSRLTIAVDALLRTDTALKSSGGDPQVLLERLVVELCGSEPRRGVSRHARAPRA